MLTINANTINEIESDNFNVYNVEDVVDLVKIEISELNYFKLLNGVKINADFYEENDFLLYCKNELFGIARIEDGFIKIKTNLKGE